MPATETPNKTRAIDAELTIRRACAADERPLIRLASRDSRPRPIGEVLVAELDGELVAARSLTDGQAIADPFRPTAAIAELVAARARALIGAGATATRRHGALITEPGLR
ncbi:MAG: hypothetical protein JJE23_01345 [Thermoleophilia bacterium]|nr:hypothetical protein [Thermoleophilia bacterium]